MKTVKEFLKDKNIPSIVDRGYIEKWCKEYADQQKPKGEHDIAEFYKDDQQKLVVSDEEIEKMALIEFPYDYPNGAYDFKSKKYGFRQILIRGMKKIRDIYQSKQPVVSDEAVEKVLCPTCGHIKCICHVPMV